MSTTSGTTSTTPHRSGRTAASQQVVDALRTAGPRSRAELARRTGLAESTVSVAVGDLIGSGLVAELTEPVEPTDPNAGPRTGRPPILIGLTRAAGLALGIDLGKRHARVVVSDLAHRVLAESTKETSVDHAAADQIEDLAGLVEDVLVEAGASRSEVIAAGMGLPGPISRDTRLVGGSSILPGWVGVPAAESMSIALGLPVVVENDANLGALGEWTWGAARGLSDVVYLKAATGIGAGLILGGMPYAGSGGTAGEIGHVLVDPGGRLCLCGNRGCLETVAGSQVVREAAGAGSLTEVIESGSEAGRAALTRAGEAIGTVLATLVNVLNPQRVVVGGSMGEAGALLLDPLRAALQEHAIASAVADAEVVVGHFGQRAEVMGALALALRQPAPLLG